MQENSRAKAFQKAKVKASKNSRLSFLISEDFDPRKRIEKGKQKIVVIIYTKNKNKTRDA